MNVEVAIFHYVGFLASMPLTSPFSALEAYFFLFELDGLLTVPKGTFIWLNNFDLCVIFCFAYVPFTFQDTCTLGSFIVSCNFNDTMLIFIRALSLFYFFNSFKIF